MSTLTYVLPDTQMFDIQEYPLLHKESEAYKKTYYDIMNSGEGSIDLMRTFFKEFSNFEHMYHIKEYLKLEDEEFRRNRRSTLYSLFNNGGGVYYSPNLIKVCKMYLENYYGEKRYKSILTTIKNEIAKVLQKQKNPLAV